MARIRSVKPEYWLDRKLARGVSRDARLLYIGLWNYADEHGRLHGDPAVIKGQVFPYDDVDVASLLLELAEAGRVQPYEDDGDPYLFLPKLAKHQRLEAAKVESRLPSPPSHCERVETPQSTRPEGWSARGTDRSARADESSGTTVALQVAGSRLQGSVAAKPPPRDDVERLCALLAERMVENGCREPHITDRWRDAARLLLDKDRQSEEEVAAVIEWSQADNFWKKNIQSMPTLREKYDRLKMNAEQPSAPVLQRRSDIDKMFG